MLCVGKLSAERYCIAMKYHVRKFLCSGRKSACGLDFLILGRKKHLKTVAYLVVLFFAFLRYIGIRQD
jgi:hypothetical protein